MAHVLAGLFLWCYLTPTIVSARNLPGFILSGTVLDPHQPGVFGARIALRQVDGRGAQHRMIIYVDNEATPSPVLQLAEARATGMFSSSGVRIEWHGRTPDGGRVPRGAIAIRLARQTRAGFLPGALAFARPFEGVHITVFWDRIEQATRPASPAVILAHVLVHEITHILQGVDRHSDSGVMKAHWTDKDYAAMAWKPLPFTPEDILLNHLGFRNEPQSRASALPHYRQ